MTATPTDADRAKATRIVNGTYGGHLPEVIAQALADARQEGRDDARRHAAPEPPRCPECGAGETDVHRRDCTNKRGRPLPDGAIPWGGACDTPGCPYAGHDVRHVHPAPRGDLSR